MGETLSNGPDKATYLKHQAVAILDREKADDARKIRKRHRNEAEMAGVPLGHMDWVIGMLGEPVGEIAKFFRQRLQLLAYNGVNIAVKIDKVLGDHTEDQTFAGQLAGMQDKPCSPPANLTPNEKQTWIAGWHEGQSARSEAAEQIDAEEAAEAEARAKKAAAVDKTTEAASELGDDGYGGDGEGEGGDDFTASEEELAAQAARPSVQEGIAADQAAAEQSPHQPAKPKRVRKTPEPV